MRAKYLTFGSPLIEQEEIDEVVDTLRSGWLSTGPKVERFEALFGKYIGAKHAVALNSCTAGLHLSLIVAGVGPGDEVITTPMTFAATANSIIHVGARPVFVDIERSSMNINPDLIKSAITNKTKAIIPVHLAGRPCKMDRIMALAKRHNLTVIEDAAHALGAEYHDEMIGNVGHLTCFSFYVTKNIVTGEGGMVTTNSAAFAERIKIYGLHGMSKGAWNRYSDKGFKQYKIIYPGYKYNMMDLQASLGLQQLPRIDQYMKKREAIWQRYNAAFKKLPLATPAPNEPGTKSALHLYTVLLDLDKLKVSRNKFQQILHRQKIGTGVHFIALHLQPYYQAKYNYKKGDFPQAEYISERTLSLPFSAKLSEQDVGDVINAVSGITKWRK